MGIVCLIPANAVLLILLAGCDIGRGVASRAPVIGPVNVSCVNSTLSSLPDAGKVTYNLDETRSTEILPKQRTFLKTTHHWLYGEDEQVSLHIIHDADGWEFHNSRVRMGPPLPPEEIARLVALIRKVNAAIQANCGLPVAALETRAVN